MRKLNAIALISAALNIALSSWLVNNYFYDANFRGWVDSAIGQYYPYIVISMGLGGGSGLGYLLLRRRGAEHSITGRLHKVKPFGHGPTPDQGQTLLAIASSAQATKHTAYSVPPLPRISPSASQSNPSLSWGAGSKSSTIRTALPQPSGVLPAASTPSFPTPPLQGPRAESSTAGLKIPRFDETFPPGPRKPPEPQPRFPPTSQWRSEPRPGSARGFEPPGLFPKQGMETGTRAVPPAPTQPPGFQQSKWQPPDSSVKPVQRIDNVPREGYSAPKWLPTPGQSPKSAEGSPQRPNPFAPQRAPFGPPQPPPRPIAYPGGARPPGVGVPSRPRPIQPDQTRPPSANPPRTVQRPPVGPTPGPQSPSSALLEKRFALTDTAGKPQDVPSPKPSSPASQSKTDNDPVPAGELDWDTALDTILKTLRKDKVDAK